MSHTYFGDSDYFGSQQQHIVFKTILFFPLQGVLISLICWTLSVWACTILELRSLIRFLGIQITLVTGSTSCQRYNYCFILSNKVHFSTRITTIRIFQNLKIMKNVTRELWHLLLGNSHTSLANHYLLIHATIHLTLSHFFRSFLLINAFTQLWILLFCVVKERILENQSFILTQSSKTKPHVHE